METYGKVLEGFLRGNTLSLVKMKHLKFIQDKRFFRFVVQEDLRGQNIKGS